MKCLVRIPFLQSDSWVPKFIQYQNRHLIDPDGVTIHQTARDMVGTLITSYMRKTIFDAWYFPRPTGPHLRVYLPINYNKHGLSRGDLDNLSEILKDIAQRDLCLMVMIYASMPGMNREEVVRRLWEQIGITDDEYDMEHFRRYFDRYGKNSTGADFIDFRKEVTRSLKAIYDGKLVGV